MVLLTWPDFPVLVRALPEFWDCLVPVFDLGGCSLFGVG